VWAAGWNVLLTLHTGSNQYLSIAYQNVTSTAAVTASATIVSAAWSMQMVTFKESSSTQITTTVIPAAAPLVLAAPPVPYKIGGTAVVAGTATIVLTVGAGGVVPTNAGDVIHVAGACAPNTQALTGVADSKGNVYAAAVINAIDPVLPACNTFHAGAAATPSIALVNGDTITLTYSGTTGDKAATVTGIPNLPASAYDLAGSGSAGGTSAAPNQSQQALAQFTEVAINSLASLNGGGAVTWDAADIPIDSEHQTTGIYLATSYQAISQPPNVMAVSGTLGASVAWQLDTDSYKEV
jgi:hypothetical protein